MSNIIIRTIDIQCNNSHSTFALSKLDRAKLYGMKKQIPVDNKYGQNCRTANLTVDGRFILPAGSTGMLFMDEKNDVLDKKELKALNEDGVELKLTPSTLDKTQQLGAPVSPEELLNYTIISIYILEPISISVEFDGQVSQFSVFRIPFQYAAGYHSHESFIVKNDNGWFLLVGEKLDFDFIGLDQADLSIPEIEYDDSLDQLDFAMM